ncbi:palmitoyl protein thioesterase-dolichol pyrophosphate phosphatase fusion 1 [Schizosaccharomyces cryophilus OY26]|uniref:Palmitoyl protein thioesterase-dolichol pyrophosphate phosphatase fusion 1 n=1 Tax=Schizosaccharomyces cryophilus (strain OY26 / ATCC MYA-4695 / CBS 11777 / NBRC 106824 / NRRL Y48691) TaxID=653667 RepID=S9X6U5_SCHCR|nr:palmitoyl protein thioesterase-dolichol pyrophosphate phosphatase fusion 1 [Schizosaccharomyces cryophilus OY26]EPY49496.1 palmitoyl protein thioesterase-dolichol pyrophosphate phosphatase fusion 1 [Schizosaccharomyces cryophilus OY26]
MWKDKGIYLFILVFFSWFFHSSQSSPVLTVEKLKLSDKQHDGEQTPVVIWHGLGDSYNSISLNSIVKRVEEITGAAVFVVHIGDSGFSDLKAGYIGNVQEQLDGVCAQLSTIEELKYGFHGIGVSQGGLFLRGLLETCDFVKIRTLLTVGSPHNGVFNFPGCSATNFFCQAASKSVLALGAWNSWVQAHIVQAQYFRTEKDFEKYLANSRFLARINNEIDHEDMSLYKKKMEQLDKLVLITFATDTIITPPESCAFGWEDEDTGAPVPMKEHFGYLNDVLGLRTLDEQDKITSLIYPGFHLELSDKEMDDLIRIYLKDAKQALEKQEIMSTHSKEKPSLFSPLYLDMLERVNRFSSKNLAPKMENNVQKRSFLEGENDSINILQDLSTEKDSPSKSLATELFMTVFSHFFYHVDDFWKSIMELFSLIPQIIGIMYLTVMVTNRELDTFMQFGGQVTNEALNYVIKNIVKDPRPSDIIHGVGYGMPSSHSQFMGYFAAYMISWAYKYRKEEWSHISSLAKMGIYCVLSFCVCSSRYFLHYHSLSQVIVGFLTGLAFGYMWCWFTGQLRVLGMTKWILEFPIIEWFYIKDTIIHTKDNHRREWLTSRQQMNQKRI